MPLKHFMIICLFVAGVRGMMTRRRRMMPCKRLAGAALHGGGGSSHILMMLGSLLIVRIHPEIRKAKSKLDNKDGRDRVEIEEVDRF
jgi:hypothetical protein